MSFVIAMCPNHVEAEPLKADRVDVFQLKSITKKRRHELTPLFSVGLNDPYVQVMTVGLSYAYHITEGFSFELRGAYSFSPALGLVNEMRQSGPNALLQPIDGSVSSDKFNPSITRPQFFAFGTFLWSPLVGKFSIGKSVIDFDIYLSAGVGYVRTIESNVARNLVGVDFGIGWRIFLARWLTLRLDLRDTIYSQQVFNTNILTHNVFFTVGLGFLFPGTPQYDVEDIE
jgi:outer membrane beta-barrel protein